MVARHGQRARPPSPSTMDVYVRLGAGRRVVETLDGTIDLRDLDDDWSHRWFDDDDAAAPHRAS
jgi:hypothetical protein